MALSLNKPKLNNLAGNIWKSAERLRGKWIAKPIIRRADSPQLGYEILPNKYFYRYQPPTPAKDLLAEFWMMEAER